MEKLKKEKGGKATEPKKVEIQTQFPEILKSDFRPLEALDFPERNVEIAKDQKEYRTLPACVIMEEEQRIITKFAFTDEDIKEIQKNKCLYHAQMTFKQSMQPVLLTVENPFLSEDEQKEAVDFRKKHDAQKQAEAKRKEEDEIIRRYNEIIESRSK